jgi:GH18 family chitinase
VVEFPHDANVAITEGQISQTSITVTLKPNNVTESYIYAIGAAGDAAAFEAGTLESCVTVSPAAKKTVAFDGLAANTEYTVFARSTDKKGVKGKTSTLVARTLSVANPKAPRCVGYLTTWDYERISNNLDWSAITHINIAFCNPDGAGNLKITDWNDQTLKGVVDKAHANGVKVLPSVRSGEASLFATAESRTSFVNKIIAYVEKFGFDGFDIDLERSEAGFWTNYEKFIIELNRRLDEKGLLLTTAVSTWFSDNITDRTFACFDFVNLMAYDLGFANHSTFEGMKQMAEHYKNVRSIPADRIVCGVPFYGYRKTATDWDDFKRYYEIVAWGSSAADVDEYDNHAYNGRPTMKRKSEFARDYGGIMIWTLNYDTTDQYSLLKVIKENLFADGTAPRPVSN